MNKVCLMKGEMPSGQGEIAIDRMYADNNSLKVGDTLIRGEKSWKITGLVALSDYSALFQNNNDSMFDSVKFGVAIVTPEEFENLDQEKLRYNYAWIYDHQPKNEKEEKKVSENLMEDIGKVVALETFVPRYLNQAIIFTGDDMGGDRAMVITLLYIVIVIMAFCVWNYHQQYDPKGSRCYRYVTCIRLYQTGADSSLYDASGSGHAGRCPDRKYSWLYRI